MSQGCHEEGTIEGTMRVPITIEGTMRVPITLARSPIKFQRVWMTLKGTRRA